MSVSEYLPYHSDSLSIVKIMERSNIVSIGTIYEEIDIMEIPTSKNGQKRYIDHLSRGSRTSVKVSTYGGAAYFINQ